MTEFNQAAARRGYDLIVSMRDMAGRGRMAAKSYRLAGQWVRASVSGRVFDIPAERLAQVVANGHQNKSIGGLFGYGAAGHLSLNRWGHMAQQFEVTDFTFNGWNHRTQTAFAVGAF
jgi:hypothetical protein